MLIHWEEPVAPEAVQLLAENLPSLLHRFGGDAELLVLSDDENRNEVRQDWWLAHDDFPYVLVQSCEEWDHEVVCWFDRNGNELDCTMPPSQTLTGERVLSWVKNFAPVEFIDDSITYIPELDELLITTQHHPIYQERELLFHLGAVLTCDNKAVPQQQEHLSMIYDLMSHFTQGEVA